MKCPSLIHDGGEDAHRMAIMSMRQRRRQRNGGQDASATTAIKHFGDDASALTVTTHA